MATFRPPHAVAVATLLLTVALFVPAAWGEILFATLAMSLPALLLLLSQTHRRRPSRRVLLAAALTAALLVGGLTVLIVLSGSDPTHPWLLGLPLPLAVQVYVIALAPLIVLGLLFARDFERYRPQRDDLERLRSSSEDRSSTQ